jgi:hypothetical protein
VQFLPGSAGSVALNPCQSMDLRHVKFSKVSHS